MDAALTYQSAIQQPSLIGESQTPAKSCRTRPSKVETRINFYATSGRRRPHRSGPLRQEKLLLERSSRAARVHEARPRTQRPTDDEATHLGMHVFDPGMRFWPQPSQLKMPKYAAASNSGCVSFAALAGSAAATNELAAACANRRRDWSTAGTRVLCCWRAGARVLCCWRAHSCWRFATHTATRQK